MKRTILLFIFLIMATSVMAASFTRELPINVAAGSTFELIYIHNTGDISGSWGALFEEYIRGGCTPAEIKDFVLSDSQLPKKITITAPAEEGSCIFHGNYQIADADTIYTEIWFPDQEVIIGTGEGRMQPPSDNTAAIIIGIIFLIVAIVIYSMYKKKK